jgi:hypothetical protein
MKIKFGLFFAASFISLSAFSASAQDAQTAQSKTPAEEPPNCKVIRTVSYPVTQTLTKKTKKRIALLDLCPADRGTVARPMLPMMIDNKPQMFEYDVVRVFKNQKEAKKYAKENNITDVGK